MKPNGVCEFVAVKSNYPEEGDSVEELWSLYRDTYTTIHTVWRR
jgi:hypothetical protein